MRHILLFSLDTEVKILLFGKCSIFSFIYVEIEIRRFSGLPSSVIENLLQSLRKKLCDCYTNKTKLTLVRCQ